MKNRSEIAGDTNRRWALWLLLSTLVVPTVEATATDPPDRTRDDLAMEDFLSHAEIVKIEDVGEGITKPKRLTLRLGQTERRAIFKTIDQDFAGTGTVDDVPHEFSDRYTYEVAAYRLDRLAGIGLVPVTVVRTVAGETGSVQLWIEDATTLEEALNDPGTEVRNFDLLIQRLGLMYVLDALIYNADRNFGNVLIDVERDIFHPIDHSRAFWLLPRPPPSARGSAADLALPADVEMRLRALDIETLDEWVGDLLEDEQIRAVLVRRDRLLEMLGRRPG